MKAKPEVLLFSDVHAKLENLVVTKSIFDQIIETCKSLKISNVIFAGDMFHTRAHQPLEVLNAVRSYFKELKKQGINVYTIHGNHDQKNQNSKVSYLLLYTNLVKHFSSFGQAKIGNNNFHFLSYFKDNDLYRKYLNQLKKEIRPGTILITHKDFNGARNNDGSKVEEGIGLKEVKEYDQVLVGHYHNKNQIGKNLLYFGAAFQHDFGEDEEKGFTIIRSDGSFYQKATAFPRFVKQKLLLEEITREDCRKLSEQYKDSGQQVRVVFYGEKYDENKIDKEVLEQVGIDVKFEKANKILESDLWDLKDIEENEKNNPIKHDKKSIVKSLLRYSKSNNFTPHQTTQILNLVTKSI